MFFDGLTDGVVNYNLPSVIDVLRYSSPMPAQPDFGSSPLHRLFWILSQLYLTGNPTLNQSIILDSGNDALSWFDWNLFDFAWQPITTSVSQNASDTPVSTLVPVPPAEVSPPSAKPVEIISSPNIDESVNETNQPPTQAVQQDAHVKKEVTVSARTASIDGQINTPIFAPISLVPLSDTSQPGYNRLPNILTSVYEFFEYLFRGSGLGWLFNTVVFLVTGITSILSIPLRASQKIVFSLLLHIWSMVTFAFQSFGLGFVLHVLEASVTNMSVLVGYLIGFVVQLATISGMTFLLDTAVSVLGWVSYLVADILHAVFFGAKTTALKTGSIIQESILSFLDFFVYFFRGIGLGWVIDGSSYLTKTGTSVLGRVSGDILQFAADAETGATVDLPKQQPVLNSVKLPTQTSLADDSEIFVTNPFSLSGTFYMSVLLLSSALLYWTSSEKYGSKLNTFYWKKITNVLSSLLANWKSDTHRLKYTGSLSNQPENTDTGSLTDEVSAMRDTDEEGETEDEFPPLRIEDDLVEHFQPELEKSDKQNPTYEAYRLGLDGVENPNDRMRSLPREPVEEKKEWRRFGRSPKSDRFPVRNAVPLDGLETRSMILPNSQVMSPANDREQPPLVYDSVADFVRQTQTFQERLDEVTEVELGTTDQNPHRSAAEEILQGSFSSVLHVHDQVSKWVSKLTFSPFDGEDSSVWETSSYEIEGSPRHANTL